MIYWAVVLFVLFHGWLILFCICYWNRRNYLKLKYVFGNPVYARMKHKEKKTRIDTLLWKQLSSLTLDMVRLNQHVSKLQDQNTQDIYEFKMNVYL